MTDRPSNKTRRTDISDLSKQLGKVPPQSTETEEAILGALMLEKDAILSVIDILKPEAFYKDSHKAIYEAIVTLFRSHEPIDIKTVVHQVRKMGMSDIEGGAAFYISNLTSVVNSASHIETHARIVYEMYLKREYIRIASDLQYSAYEDTIDAFDLQEKVETEVFRLSQESAKKEPQKLLSVASETIADIEQKKKKREEKGFTGIPTGFRKLDEATGGWQDTDLIIIAGRTSMGKTAFVVSTIRACAIDNNIPAAFFSLEMSSGQLVTRLISQTTELNASQINQGRIDSEGMQRIVIESGKWGDAPLYLDDTPGISIVELRAKCRRLKQKYGIKLVVVDYLQLMSGDKTSYKGNREQEISSISRGLKEIAKECDLPVIALSQLSRDVEKRGGDKIPKLSDLRESGSLEQDSDLVLFLYRAEYYGIYEDTKGQNLRGIGEVIIAKNRQGALDNIHLKFVGKRTQWMDLEESTQPVREEYREPTGEKGNNDDDGLPF